MKTLLVVFCFLMQAALAYEPLKIGELAFINKNSILDDIAIKDECAYVAFRAGASMGIHVVDIKKKAKLVIDTTIPADDLNNLKIPAQTLFIQDNYLYALTNDAKLVIFQLVGNVPKFVSAIYLTNASNMRTNCIEIKILDGIAYLIASRNGLIAVDISDKKNPRIVWHSSDNLKCACDIDISSDYIYVTDKGEMARNLKKLFSMQFQLIKMLKKI